MNLKGKKIGILIESDYYENEIIYYHYRFPEEGAILNFLSRLWGNPPYTMAVSFKGHEYKIPFSQAITGDIKSFEKMDDKELKSYDAIIIPAGMVADRLRYTEDIKKLPPACQFMKRAFAEKGILKGIICHGMWLLAPVPELIKGRKAVVHNNLLGDLKNMEGIYVDKDVVVDDDLVTARTGGHCNVFAQKIIELLSKK